MTYEDIRYAPYIRHFWSLCKNLRYLKFESLFRRLYDKKYRADIAHQWKVTGEFKLASMRTTMQINWIHPSHQVIYGDWVLTLRQRLRFGERLPPIKIIWDRFNCRYITIDGNHRLDAYRAECSPTMDIPVILLYPKYDRHFDIRHERKPNGQYRVSPDKETENGFD
jgi:hypothetical protein